MKAVHVYIQLSPSQFPPEDEERRILWALSYIRGGSAGAWAENHTEAILDPNVESPFITFEGFLNTFEAAYCELDCAEMACQKIKPALTSPANILVLQHLLQHPRQQHLVQVLNLWMLTAIVVP